MTSAGQGGNVHATPGRSVRRRLLHGPLARAATMPSRVALAGGHAARVAGESARWLVRSREHTNFTYDLRPLNREHLAWFVAHVTGCTHHDALGFFVELESDDKLREVVAATTRASSRRRVADQELRWHRHLGWYAIVRSLKPQHVVETGTDKGLGSLVLASAVMRNGSGRVTTIDIVPDRGYLIQPPYSDVVTMHIDDSLPVLSRLDPVDLFIHDSLHTFEHEAAEFRTVAPCLTDDAMVLSDNAHVTNALAQWAEATGRRFLYWHEQPVKHWYPGDGIGAAWHAPEHATRKPVVDP